MAEDLAFGFLKTLGIVQLAPENEPSCNIEVLKVGVLSANMLLNQRPEEEPEHRDAHGSGECDFFSAGAIFGWHGRGASLAGP